MREYRPVCRPFRSGIEVVEKTNDAFNVEFNLFVSYLLFDFWCLALERRHLALMESARGTMILIVFVSSSTPKLPWFIRDIVLYLVDKEFNVITLTEGGFHKCWEKKKKYHKIKQITWKNKKLMKTDKNENIEDTILGVEDLAGYISYNLLYIGAIMDGMTYVVCNASFGLNTQYQ